MSVMLCYLSCIICPHVLFSIYTSKVAMAKKRVLPYDLRDPMSSNSWWPSKKSFAQDMDWSSGPQELANILKRYQGDQGAKECSLTRQHQKGTLFGTKRLVQCRFYIVSFWFSVSVIIIIIIIIIITTTTTTIIESYSRPSHLHHHNYVPSSWSLLQATGLPSKRFCKTFLCQAPQPKKLRNDCATIVGMILGRGERHFYCTVVLKFFIRLL